MVRKTGVVQAGEMTPEEERAYWDTQDPLRQGKRARLGHPQPPKDRLSFFALRLSGRDIGRLAELAQQRGMKPSELARALILQGLQRSEESENWERRVALLAEEVTAMKKQLTELAKRSN